MKIITLLNEKGGVGKTTLAGTLGAGLALRGYRVLMVDADAQANLTLNLALPKMPHFYDFVKRSEVETKELIRRVPQDVVNGALYLVSGNEETSGLPFSSRVADIGAMLTKRLKQLERAFDFVIIDTSPTPNTLHDAITLITDWIIFPTDAEMFSVDGLESSINHTRINRQDALLRKLDKARIMGIVVNKFRNVGLHEMYLNDLREQYGDLVWEPIPQRIAVSESQYARAFLLQDASELSVTKNLWAFIERVLETVEKQNV
jgi:chromosome partitioning protein